MTTWTTHHPCPEPECEDGEVTAEYEIGKWLKDFILTTDGLTCSQGHSIPQAVLDCWWEQDSGEYMEQRWARWEEAQNAHKEEG